MTAITGLHHITLVTRSAQPNRDFYTKTLGLRLVKKTVNFDDPSAYHLYYGDTNASPGTAITFFEWKHATPGSPGIGGTQHLSLCFGSGGASTRLIDPDGVQIETLGEPNAQDYAGMARITAISSDLARTEAFYSGVLGLHTHKISPTEWAWSATATSPTVLHYLHAPRGTPRVRMGAGQTHHFALAVPDDATQLAFIKRIRAAGLRVTDVLDRSYFHSIYTNDPDGHIVEIATVPPGFTIDEPLEHLGEKLMLPAWLEPHRGEIEATLTPLR